MARTASPSISRGCSPPPGPGTELALRAVGGHGEWPIGTVTVLAGQVEFAPAAMPAVQGMSRRQAEAARDHAAAARLPEAALLDDPEDADLLLIRARFQTDTARNPLPRPMRSARW
jgi:hypothetical protein